MTEKRIEQLKDRQAYRFALINRRVEVEVKIDRVEAQIKKIKEEDKIERESFA